MLLSTINKPIFNLLRCIRQNMPYQIFTPQDVIAMGWKNDEGETNHYTYIVFNKDKNKFFWLDCGINIPDFISDCKQILTDKTAKHQIFCQKTLDVIAPRLGSINNKWLFNIEPQKGIIHLAIDQKSSLIYNIEKQNNEIKFTIYCQLEKLSGLIAIKSAGILTPDGEINITEKHARTYEYKNDIEQQAKTMGYMLLQFVFFLQFAEVETRIVNNKNKRAVVDGEKIVNQTDFEIEVINSNYYTTIMRTEGFNVRGHWRWQPYGSGDDKKVKLIYIRDFEKHGYTRKAKILSEPQNVQNNLTTK